MKQKYSPASEPKEPLTPNIGAWISDTANQVQAELQMLNKQLEKNEVETARLKREWTDLNSLLQQKLGALMLLNNARSNFAAEPSAPIPDVPAASDTVAETSEA